MPDDLAPPIHVPNILALGDDAALLEALGDVLGKFAELKTHITGLASVEELLGKIAAGAQDDTVKQAFAAVGLAEAHATLVRLVSKITDAANRIPDKYRRLLEPIGSFQPGDPAAIVTWTVATPATPIAQGEEYRLELGAQGEIAFNAAASLPGAAAAKLLQLGAHGKVTAAATASLPYAFGLVKAGAGGGVETTLDYYFAANDAAFYAAAVAGRMAVLPNPFELHAVWDAVQNERLEGLIYTFGGSAHAQVEVAFADTHVLGPQIAADLGLTVAVSATHKTDYALKLRRNAGGAAAATILAELSRSRLDEASFAARLQLEVDPSELTKPIVAAMQRAVGKWDDLLKEVKPFLSPGTWLRDHALAEITAQAEGLIADQTFRAALLSDVKGALGVGLVSNSKVAEWLAGKVTGAVDQASVLVDGKLDEAVDRALQALESALPILSQSSAANSLKDFVKTHVEKVDAALKAQVGKLVQQPGNLKKAIEAAGAKVNGGVASLDGALKAVRDLLDHYDDALHEILGKAEAAAKAKATARLYVEETRSSGDVVEIKGEFTALTPESANVFHALTRGKLQALVHVLEQPAQAPGFTLDPDSAITRFSKSKSAQGLEISLLGFDLSLTEFVRGEASLVLDGRRNLRVTSEGEARKILSIFNTREVSFVDSHALALTAATRANPASGAASLRLGVGASYSEKSLEWDDVEAFIGSLERARLVSASALPAAQATFARLRPSGAKFHGDISAELALDGAHAETLMQLPHRTATGLDDASRLRIVETALRSLRDLHAVDAQKSARAFFLARQEFKLQPPPPSDAELVLRYRKAIFPIHLPTGQGMPDRLPTAIFDAADDRILVDHFFREAFALERLVDLVERMGATYLATPTAGASGGWTVDDYRKAQESMAKDSVPWMTVARDLEGLLFKADVTPRTLAFLRTLADLAGLGAAAPGGVEVTLTYRPAQGGAQTASFT